MLIFLKNLKKFFTQELTSITDPLQPITDAVNGLSVDDNKVRLGGKIIEDTIVDNPDAHQFTISGAKFVGDGSGLTGLPTSSIKGADNGLVINSGIIGLGGSVSSPTQINADSMLFIRGNFGHAPNLFIGSASGSDAQYPLLELNSGQVLCFSRQSSGRTVTYILPKADKPMSYTFVADDKTLFFIRCQSGDLIYYTSSDHYYRQISNQSSSGAIISKRCAMTVVCINNEWQISSIAGTWYDESYNPII